MNQAINLSQLLDLNSILSKNDLGLLRQVAKTTTDPIVGARNFTKIRRSLECTLIGDSSQNLKKRILEYIYILYSF